MVELNEEQKSVYDYVINWIRKSLDLKTLNYLVVGGYAGTGKTTLISKIRDSLKDINRVALCSYTGKAASVLSEKMIGIFSEYDYIGTIHKLIYTPVFEKDEDGKQVLVRWRKKSYDEFNYELIFVDESSMISREIWQDLKYYGVPIVFFGDHFQLPPVSNDNFNIMSKPHISLKTIHRQAFESSIIKLSYFIRKNGYIPNNKKFSNKVFKVSWNSQHCKNYWNSIDFDSETISLCGMNRTRVIINNMIRERLNFNNIEPYPGERLVCLKNNYDNKVMNGQIGTLLWLLPYSKDVYRSTIEFDKLPDLYEGLISNCCLNKINYNEEINKFNSSKSNKKNKKILDSLFDSIDFFDFGYCISVHKSQGSEWNRVILFEEKSYYWDDIFYAKWLYTAVTRSRDKLFIISDF